MARIVKHDHPALWTPSEPVLPSDDLSFLRTMEMACKGSLIGVGLAANQIGVMKRAIFLYPQRMNSWAMLNPRITWASDGTTEDVEGCLSFPSVETRVARHDQIEVEWQRTDFSIRTERFIGFEARVIQHEIDHINGICRVGEAWRALKEKSRNSASVAMAAVGAVLVGGLR